LAEAIAGGEVQPLWQTRLATTLAAKRSHDRLATVREGGPGPNNAA